MTKTTKTTTHTAKAAKTKAKEVNSSIMQTLEAVQEQIAVPAAAREFVATQAATAQQHAEKAHEGANRLNADIEKATVSIVGQYASFTKGLVDMTIANVERALATMEKVSAAKTLPEAMRIQADYVRENAKANYDRVKDAAETANKTASQAGASVRDQTAKLWAQAGKAA